MSFIRRLVEKLDCIHIMMSYGVITMRYPSLVLLLLAKSLQSCPTLCDPIDSRDSPGKSTGVGCHFLLQCMKVKSESEVAQEWGAIAFSDGTQYPDPISGKLNCQILVGQKCYNFALFLSECLAEQCLSNCRVGPRSRQ